MPRRREWWILFARNARVAIKSPKGTIALALMAVVNTFMLISVFAGVGKKSIGTPESTTAANAEEVIAENARVTQSWIGVINYAATDQFLTLSMAQVLVLPKQKMIFRRERSNKMYTATTFFLAMWVLSTLLATLYPILSSALAFGSLGFADSSAANFFCWFGVLLLQALAGSSFGFMVGSICDDEKTGLLIT